MRTERQLLERAIDALLMPDIPWAKRIECASVLVAEIEAHLIRPRGHAMNAEQIQTARVRLTADAAEACSFIETEVVVVLSEVMAELDKLAEVQAEVQPTAWQEHGDKS